MILFLAAINLTASLYNAALPAMLLSRQGGGQAALGLVNTCTGLATVAGSVLVTPRARAEEPGEGDLQHATAFHGN